MLLVLCCCFSSPNAAPCCAVVPCCFFCLPAVVTAAAAAADGGHAVPAPNTTHAPQRACLLAARSWASAEERTSLALSSGSPRSTDNTKSPKIKPEKVQAPNKTSCLSHVSALPPAPAAPKLMLCHGDRCGAHTLNPQLKRSLLPHGQRKRKEMEKKLSCFVCFAPFCERTHPAHPRCSRRGARQEQASKHKKGGAQTDRSKKGHTETDRSFSF